MIPFYPYELARIFGDGIIYSIPRGDMLLLEVELGFHLPDVRREFFLFFPFGGGPFFDVCSGLNDEELARTFGDSLDSIPRG